MGVSCKFKIVPYAYYYLSLLKLIICHLGTWVKLKF